MVPSAVSSRAKYYSTLSLIVVLGLLYLWVAAHQPDGRWDAWAIWNLRARFFAFAPDVRMAFDPAFDYYSHLDYPILLPVVIALIWKVTGFTVWVPIAVHGAIFLAMLWMLRHSWVGMVLAGCSVMFFATQQFADVPLGVCLLGAVYVYTHKRETLTGVMLGLALNLKNEGIIIAAAFFAAWILFERRIPFRALAAMLPFAALLIAFKVWVDQPNDLAAGGIDFAKLIDRQRYGIVRSFAISHIAELGGGGLALLMVYAWATRTQLRFTVPLIAIGLVFVAYIGIYLNTPQDLDWHLITSFDRLMVHLFPTLVFEITRMVVSPAVTHAEARVS